MPDQRMHDLWINSESAYGHKCCEVHDIRFIDNESVASWTAMRTPRSLRLSGAGRANVLVRWPAKMGRGGEPKPMVENTWAR